MMKTASRIVLSVLLAFFIFACVNSIQAEPTYCTFCCTPNCGGANGNSTPAPTPTPSPTPSPDFVVAPSGGDFTSIHSAYSAASCGDLIWVRGGTYTFTSVLNLNKNCTEGNELVIQAYPDESPVVTCSNPTVQNPQRVEHSGAYNVWDGIEIKGCYDGVKVYSSNFKVLNSKIHHNLYQGILIAAIFDKIENIVIDGNEIYGNGFDESTGAGTCINSEWNPAPPHNSQKHCHGIYISDAGCQGTENIIITGNHIYGHGGRGLQWNGDGCQTFSGDSVVTGNTFENNSINVILWGQVRGADISHNTFILKSWPATDDSEHVQLAMYRSTGNTVSHNTFTMTANNGSAYQFMDFHQSASQTSFDFNTWNIPSGANGNRWRWNGGVRTDFSAQWKNVTGWDANGTIHMNRR